MTFGIFNRHKPLTVGALLLLGSIASSSAQTQFTYDGAGNRTGQEAGAATASPQITVPPANQLGKLGGTARFSVVASGQGPFTYEWFKDGAPIPDAASDTLVLTGLTSGDFTPTANSTPKYYVRVTNAHGSDISAAVELYQDSQGAGLPNWWRQQYFGSTGPVNPYADADGDGITNGQEYADGSQPNNAASRRARVTLAGPQGLLSKFPDQDTYAGGTAVSASGSHSGELQFGGFTGSYRSKAGSHSFAIRGSNDSTADVVLKGLFGAMPVQTNVAAPTFTYSDNTQASVEGFVASTWGGWLAYGYFDRVNGQPRVGVARFAPDGTLDTSFAPNPNGQVTGAAYLPGGSMLIAGFFSDAGGQQRPGIARFTPYGVLDTAFAPTFQGAGFPLITAMKVQGDGKILLGGGITDGSGARYVVRLNADGTTDASFTTTTDSQPVTWEQQADGKILMGGNFTQVNGIATPKLVRLNLDGTLDGSFNVNAATGAITSAPDKVLVQPDGKILVSGAVQVRLNGNTVTLPLVRLNADGTVDTAFTQKVQALVPSVTFAEIALQTDGRIVGVGTFTLTSPAVVNAVRFKPDGSVDPDCFVISRPNGPVRAVAAQMDGSLLMGGAFSDVAVADAMVNNHAYLITPGRMNWTDAEAYAVKLGGHLVSIGGVKENYFMGNTLLPMALGSAPAWIGLHDTGTEGLFAWTSGEPATFTSWQGGEPNNVNNEDAGLINYFAGAPGNWSDAPDAGVPNPGQPTDGPYQGIIEVDPGSTPPTTVNWVAGRDMLANERAGASAKLTNPNPTVPAWSYGRRTTLASSDLTLFSTQSQRHVDGAIEGWEAPNSCGVLVNTTNAPGFYLGPRPLHVGEMYLHPGSNLEYAVVRWTAPQAGTYVVTGFWQDFSWGSGDGGSGNIVVNGAVIFSSDFDNGNGAFDTKILTLNAGDTVDFALGARGGYESDGTRFNAVVTKVTEGLSDLWCAGQDMATNEKPDGHVKESTNPSPQTPAWSYGERTVPISAGLDLFTAGNHLNSFTGTATDDTVEGWVSNSGIGVNTGTTPVAYNYGSGPNLPFNANEMLVFPGGSGHLPVVRWTAPDAGRYDVFAYWHDSDAHGGNGIDGFILVNGAQVYGQDMDNGAGCSTVQSLDLKAGDQVDFLLGTRGEFSYDVTKFNAVIVRPADAVPRTVASGTVTQATTRAEIAATGKIDWATAAPNGVDVSGNPFVIESTAGHRYHVRKATMGNFRRLTQGSGWAGNFAPGAALLNHGNSDGPVIIESASLSGGCSAIGMQIEANQPGPFVATLHAYDANGVLLTTVTANGTSAATGDNSAVFLGVKSTAENIHSVSVDTNTTDWGGDFAINEVSIKASTANSLSNPRTNFARLVPTNSTRPIDFYAAFQESIFPPNAPTTLYMTSEVTGAPVSFATLETSTDGVSFQPFGYGVSTGAGAWSFPVGALPPGYNYFRAMLRNTDREEARSHATILVTPPVVTSLLTVAGEVGTPFSYTGMATGKLTGFAASALPAWATATFDTNSNLLTISGTPTTGGKHSIALQPANEAGSTSSTLTLSISSSFTRWQEANFTAGELANPNISGPLGDATGAGIKNLIKYALGIPPKQPGAAGLPTGAVVEDAGAKYLTLTYTRDVSADVILTVEVSPNLGAGTWISGSPHTTELSRVPQAGNKETVTVRDNVPITNGQKHFMRLKVME